jgi:hypothetical protein
MGRRLIAVLRRLSLRVGLSPDQLAETLRIVAAQDHEIPSPR